MRDRAFRSSLRRNMLTLLGACAPLVLSACSGGGSSTTGGAGASSGTAGGGTGGMETGTGGMGSGTGGAGGMGGMSSGGTGGMASGTGGMGGMASGTGGMGGMASGTGGMGSGTGGTGGGVSCGAGITLCGDTCVDTKNDPQNCGACANACPAGQVCSMGACALQCSGGSTKCGDTCVDTKNDPQNCGACANACPAGQVCSMGACGLSCAGGTVQCGNACTSTSFDPQNCGACGKVCPGAPNAAATCGAGTCDYACNALFGDCNGNTADGCETGLASNPASCGACGNACPAPANAAAACTAGACGLGACNMGFGNCDNNAANGCEANLLTSNTDCGTCGNACAGGLVCKNGTCAPAQFTFQSSQTIDGKTVTCSSVVNTAAYTECDDLQVEGLYMPNGINCGPAWSTTNSKYSDTVGFCQSLTGSPNMSVYYNCNTSTARATWSNHVWGTFNDNGYSQHVRCYY